MPLERRTDGATATLERRPRPALRLVPQPPLRVVDVAAFYGERSGGIRTYLDAKRAFAAQHRDVLDHHVIVPGPKERHHPDGRHELRSLRIVATNGYRVPLSIKALTRTIGALRPDVVLLHDAFWGPVDATAAAHAVGAKVVAVHHASAELEAAGLPGPTKLYGPPLRVWMRHAHRPVDALMSVVDTSHDTGRTATLPLGLGVDPVFRPQPAVRRGDGVLYVGRLAREKGILRLLDAAAVARRPWPLRLVGSGPLEDRIMARAERLGIADRVAIQPFVSDRARLARMFAGAGCVVLPGEHETFGLVALEAGCSGTRVVTCDTAPAHLALEGLCHTFPPGDTEGLEVAIDRALHGRVDHLRAARLGEEHRWDRLFATEVDALRDLVR
ncbi:glycosyltransferase [Conexibacter sp. SYSU D00693]|uniref:glycosyltransferase n=1 Tax=Conexibacter sp. SYSU D00693 TaxID=2812560 RepID=UPI00196B8B27|nr:glycosyltransferase [Conexibacter sp. SYSU D00693]